MHDNDPEMQRAAQNKKVVGYLNHQNTYGENYIPMKYNKTDHGVPWPLVPLLPIPFSNI